MGKWMEEYGETVLAGVAGLMVIVLLLTSGILSAVGTKAKIEENSYQEYKEFTVFSELCQRKKPEIICNTEKQWHIGEIISIEEAFVGTDADGNRIGVKVEAIDDRDGVSHMEKYDKETHQVIFQKPGIYIFTLKVQDEENLCVTRRIEFSVDNRKVGQ